MTNRQRADRLLVARGLFASRAQAQAAIAAGRVSADGVVVGKASDAIATGAVIEAEPAHPFVSRGGVKLAAALDHFRIDVTGRVCVDVGASTGGFTQLLLHRGARRVYAVDVGRGQLHASLRDRREITALEQTDIRSLDAARIGEQPNLATVDVSFISLKLVVPPIGKLLRPGGRLLALIKPQFEAGRAELKKGIVRDAEIHARVCDDIAEFLAAQGWHVGGRTPSPILGGDGNAEFFIEAELG
ncbi:MAG: TlyA family RNA methyltransferase [Hyphomicrobiales bacterium]|nr:TlyA family RNA methyltransferase [Hyphomicrobiales bacterium]MDE2285916.1 TlyA family RNA methyltransferase [Hyphomicrobiales bacterium]